MKPSVHMKINLGLYFPTYPPCTHHIYIHVWLTSVRRMISTSSYLKAVLSQPYMSAYKTQLNNPVTFLRLWHV